MRRLLHAILLFQATISTHSELVVVPAFVTDPQGRYVSGLTQDQFRLFEDGRPRPIVAFQQGEASLTLGLIVDRSESMQEKDEVARAAVLGLLQSSQPDDELFAVDFNNRVTLALPPEQPFTNDREALAAAIAAVPSEGRTALYDAVEKGLTHLTLGRAERQALIIVSDGGDNASRRQYEQIRTLARQSRTVIYAVGLLNENDGDDEDAALLKRLCKDSGGVAYFPRTIDEITALTALVARELRQLYTLGFVPGEGQRPGVYHTIEVKVVSPNHRRLIVRARPGYLAQ